MQGIYIFASHPAIWSRSYRSHRSYRSGIIDGLYIFPEISRWWTVVGIDVLPELCPRLELKHQRRAGVVLPVAPAIRASSYFFVATGSGRVGSGKVGPTWSVRVEASWCREEPLIVLFSLTGPRQRFCESQVSYGTRKGRSSHNNMKPLFLFVVCVYWQGLAVLRNRGYDSAGMATSSDQGLMVSKYASRGEWASELEPATKHAISHNKQLINTNAVSRWTNKTTTINHNRIVFIDFEVFFSSRGGSFFYPSLLSERATGQAFREESVPGDHSKIHIAGDHSKQDLRYTQRPIYLPVFTDNIWSYLLWSPLILVRTHVTQKSWIPPYVHTANFGYNYYLVCSPTWYVDWPVLQAGYSNGWPTGPCVDVLSKNEGVVWNRRTSCHGRKRIPFRTAVSFWGQTTQNSSSLSPKRDHAVRGAFVESPVPRIRRELAFFGDRLINFVGSPKMRGRAATENSSATG